MNQTLLSVKEVSSLLNVHPNTIYLLARSGEIPSIKKKGVGIRFRREEIEEWLARGSHRAHQISELLPKLDLSLDEYDKMVLRRRTELKDRIRWNYGIGSVVLRKTKNKEERYYIDYQVDNRRVRKVVKGARTRAEAVKALNSEVADVCRGQYNFQADRKRITFGDMADLFLEKYSKVNKKSWKTSDWVYLRRLKPYFGSYGLPKISPEMVEEYKSERLSTGIKKCSVNRELSCIRKVFNVAIAWGYTKTNPLKDVRFYSEKENIRERVLSEDEEVRLLAASSPHLMPILKVALNTGMRKGEIFKMRWENVDFEKREVRIPESKSGTERRIPINSALFALLHSLRSRDGNHESVFSNPETGKPYVDIKRAFSGACRRASITNLRFHDLRHSFASRLVSRGVDIVIIKELMGHASIVTTQRYLHSQASEKLRAVETLASKPGILESECQKNVNSEGTEYPGKPLTSMFLGN